MAKTEKATSAPVPGRQIPYLPVGLAVVVAAVALLYFLDVMSEAALGVLIAVAVGLAIAGYLATAIGSVAESRAVRVTAIALGLATGVLAVLPVVLSIMPGQPVAQGSFNRVGDGVSVPADVSGPVRLLLHAGMAGGGTAQLQFVIGGAVDPVEGHLERSTSNVRVGRRGSATVSHERNAEFLASELSGAGKQLKLDRLDGALSGPMEVQVYRDYWPLGRDLIAVAVLLALTIVIVIRWQLSTALLAATGAALFFGVMGYQFITPGVVVRSEIGAMIVGGLLGVVIAGLAGSIARRLTSGRHRQKGGARAQG